MGIDKKQPQIRDKLINTMQYIVPLIFSNNHLINFLQNKLKKLKKVLIKKSLLKNQILDSGTIVLEYITSYNYSSYDFLPNKNYFAQVIINNYPDFQKKHD